MSEQEDPTVVAVAEAMRETYGKWLNEGPLMPFVDSDKRGVWLLIAKAGIAAYEKAGKKGRERKPPPSTVR